MVINIKKIIIISTVIVFFGIISFSLFTAYQKLNPDRAYREIGSRWVSSDPNIIYWVNPDGLMRGTMKYNGKAIKLLVGSHENSVTFTADNGTAMSYDSDLSFSAGIRKSSDTKIVLQVYGSNIPDFKYKQITFTRSQ